MSDPTSVSLAPGETRVMKIPELQEGSKFTIDVDPGIEYTDIQNIPTSYAHLFNQTYSYNVSVGISEYKGFKRLLYPGSVVSIKYNFEGPVSAAFSYRPLSEDQIELGAGQSLENSLGAAETSTYDFVVENAGEYRFRFYNKVDRSIDGSVEFDMSITSIDTDYDRTDQTTFTDSRGYIILRNTDRVKFLDYHYFRTPSFIESIQGTVESLIIVTISTIAYLYYSELNRVVVRRLGNDAGLQKINRVGPEVADQFERMGIVTVGDLRKMDRGNLEEIQLSKEQRGNIIEQMYFTDAPILREALLQIIIRTKKLLKK